MKFIVLSIVLSCLLVQADWSSFGGDNAHSASSPEILLNLDNANVTSTDNLAIKSSSAPVIVGDVAYIYSATASNGCIRALNAETLEQIWAAPVPISDSGFGSWSTPSVANDSIVYAADDFLGCWNMDGSLRWQISMDHQTVNSSPLITDGRIHIGAFSYVNAEGGIGCFDIDTGQQLWFSTNINNSTFSSCSPVADGNGYGYAACSNQLWKFVLYNGKTIWSRDLPGKGLSNVSVTKDGTVLAVNYDYLYAANNLFAYDSRGNKLWQAATGQSSVAPSIYQTEDMDICIHSCGDSGVAPALTAFDLATGTQIWQVEGFGSYSGLPAIADGNVYAASPLFSSWSFIGMTNFSSFNVVDGSPTSSIALNGGHTPAIANNSIYTVDDGKLVVYSWDFKTVVIDKYNAKIFLEKTGKDIAKLKAEIACPDYPEWLENDDNVHFSMGSLALIPADQDATANISENGKKVSYKYQTKDGAIKVSMVWSEKKQSIKFKATVKKSNLTELLDFNTEDKTTKMPIFLLGGDDSFAARGYVEATVSEKKEILKIKQ